MHKNKLIKTIILVAAMIILVGGMAFGFYRYNELKASTNLANTINKSISKNLENAKKAIENDELDKATKYLEKVLKVDKDNKEVANLQNIIEKNRGEKAAIIKKEEEDAAAAIVKKQDEAAAAIVKKQEEEKASANKTLTHEQAIEVVKKQFPDYKNNANLHYEYDHDSSHDGRQFYVIHIFEYVDSHTATMGWYGIDTVTGRIYDEMTFKYIN